MPDIRWYSELNPDHRAELIELLRAVRARDGRPEPGPDGGLPENLVHGSHVLARSGDALVGYAHLDRGGDSFGREIVELFVHPDHRGRGYGGALAAAVTERAERALRFWSHGDHPAAARIARRAGLRRVRELLRMRTELDGQWLGEPELPDGVRLRTFVPGQDEAAVIEVNGRAFSWHPEQGSLSEQELVETERQDWFDPDGFFLAVDGDGTLLGFHWTKVHPPDPQAEAGSPHARAAGEVYVVGVDPSAHGRGLGTALTLAGLHYLAGSGLDQAILYVEGDNPAAIAVYTGLGFRTETTDVQYELAGRNS
ncbi:mycothiol synthase [Haloechinothrix sp. LS1_15]|uniref:mycothiol synthase n=1 Tax=Haloechinothrix sp. LS1_15 TaxID=2652248 RepID=UPI002943FFD4|nr:mycothiol synthase [Haloechinothrix sp. LS1_15]MDV6012466.1 mycothiol synthase [Haloechinothrix sp. LS1_15]